MPPRPAPTLSSLNIAPKVAAFEALGLDVERILTLARLTREAFSDPNARLPVRTEFALWDAAIAVSGDPALGLHVAQHMQMGAYGGYEYLLRNSATVAQAIDRAARYIRLIDDLSRITTRVEGATAVMRLSRDDGYALPPAECECLFGTIVSVLRAELQDSRVEAVHFAHPAPPDPQAYEQHFACRVRFGQPAYEIVFPLEMLDKAPTRRADPELGRVLEEHAQLMLERLPARAPFLEEVRAQMRVLLPSGQLSSQNLARALHMSERSLRRHLQNHETSYQELLDTLRGELAREYVARSHDGFDVIATRLAFHDPSAFFRAFKRWTGTTPASFRDSARARR